MSDLSRTLAQMETRQRNLVRNLIARGEISAVTIGNMQGLQAKLFAGEVKGGIEHFEPYGFTSHPLAGAEPVVLFPGGDRSHGIAVVVADRRYRVKVQAGEVCVHDDQGQMVHLTRTGIVIDAGTRRIEVACGDFVVDAKGDITLRAGGTLREESDAQRVTTRDYEAVKK